MYYLKLPLNLKIAQQHLSLCIFLPLSWFEAINLSGHHMYSDLLCFRGRSSTWSCSELTHTFYISKWTIWLREKGWKLQGALVIGSRKLRRKSVGQTCQDRLKWGGNYEARGPMSSRMALESQTAGMQGPVSPGALWHLLGEEWANPLTLHHTKSLICLSLSVNIVSPVCWVIDSIILVFPVF